MHECTAVLSCANTDRVFLSDQPDGRAMLRVDLMLVSGSITTLAVDHALPLLSVPQHKPSRTVPAGGQHIVHHLALHDELLSGAAVPRMGHPHVGQGVTGKTLSKLVILQPVTLRAAGNRSVQLLSW